MPAGGIARQTVRPFPPHRRDHPDVDQRNWWEIDPEVTFVCDPGMRNGVALGRGVGMQGRGPAPCSAFTTRWQLTAEEGEVAIRAHGCRHVLARRASRVKSSRLLGKG